MDQFKDIYYKENVISSDEYENTYDEDLMGAAISTFIPKKEGIGASIDAKVTSIFEKIRRKVNDQYHKRGTPKLGLKLKKKSISWMCNKFRRDQLRNRYLFNLARAKAIKKKPKLKAEFEYKTEIKEFLLDVPKLESTAKESSFIVTEPKISSANAAQKVQIEHETIDLDDTDEEDTDEDAFSENDESISNSSKDDDNKNDDNDNYDNDDVGYHEEEIEDINEDIQDVIKDKKKVDKQFLSPEKSKENELEQKHMKKKEIENAVETHICAPFVNNGSESEKDGAVVSNLPIQSSTCSNLIKSPSNVPHARNLLEVDLKLTTEIEKTITGNINLTDTSFNTKDVDMAEITQVSGVKHNFFFSKELNDMYITFDKIINDHVHFPETVEILKRKIHTITSDIKIIKKAREAAEKELNRLIFVQHTKEQIIERMMRKIKYLEVNSENLDAKEIENCELRLLDQALKKTQIRLPPLKKRKIEPTTVNELLAYHATMSMDEILREKTRLNIKEK